MNDAELTTAVAPPRGDLPEDSRVDAAEVLTVEVPCFACGYNLRGAARQASCPECGRPVADSLLHSDLSRSDSTWLWGLARGVLWLAIVMGVGVPTMVVGMFLFSIFGLGGTGGLPSLVGLGLVIVASVSIWKLAAPEPGRQPSVGLRARQILRRWSLVAGCVAALVLLRAFVSVYLVNGSMGFDLLPLLLNSLFALLLIPCVSVYLVSLARRAGRPALARQSKLVMWSLLIATVIGAGLLVGFVVILAMSFAAAWNGGPRTIPDAVVALTGIVLLGVAVAWAVLYVWTVVLLTWYYRVFREMRRLASAREAKQLAPATVDPPSPLAPAD